jgi:hypothetical protein
VYWGFVDYENTGSLEGIDAKSYERLLIFCGPNNSKLKLGDLPTTEFTKIELIGIKTNGANNLDFHLAFYLGRYHEIAENNVEFHVISNDDGFNGIVNHIKNIGRKCKKVETRKKIDQTKPKTKKPKIVAPLSECAELIVSGLKQIDGKKRPRKQKTLTNWIKSHCSHLKTAVNAGKILEELSSNSLISVNSSNVSYKF